MKKNKGIQKKIKKNFLQQKQLLYSGFCLTDNNKFIFFDIDDDFLLENNIKISKDTLKVTEHSLEIAFDRENNLQISGVGNKIYFEGFGERSIDKEIFDFIRKKYPECVFYKITEFFGKKVNTLVMVLQEAMGKPFGVLKTLK